IIFFSLPFAAADFLIRPRHNAGKRVRKWWNWQTHHLEGVAPKGVGVQIPPSAPKLFPAMKGRPGGRFGLDSYELFDWPHLHRTHSGVLLSDHRGAAAERQERRHCCGFRRHGEPDSIWSPWCRHSTLEGHHV